MFGQGLIGLFAVQYARIAGAALSVGIDLLPRRLAVARACGANVTINPNEVSVEDEVRQVTSERGLNIVVEAIGSAEAMKTALKVAGDLGRVIALGSSRTTVDIDVYTDIHRKGLSLIGAHGRTHPAVPTVQNPWTWLGNLELAMQYAAQGRLLTENLVSHRLPAVDCLGIWQQLVDHPEEYLGVIIDWEE